MFAEESEFEVIHTVTEEGDADTPASPSPELEDKVTAEASAGTPDVAKGEQEAEPIEAAAEIVELESEEPVQESKAEETENETPVATPDVEEEQETAVEGTAPQAEATLESEIAPQDDRAWYVIHCYSGHENKVKHNLEQRIETMQLHDQIFQVVVPTEDEIEVRDGKRRTVERRVFPGYILVQMLLSDDSWYAVRNTPGVTGFVGMGNRPAPLRPEEVQAILKRMEADAPKIKVTFKQGQKVRIVDGPFNEFIGVVDELDMERAKVRVLVSFFGRDTPVELDFLQVEKT